MAEGEGERLIIVSNRGPAEFGRGAGGERVVNRGGGGLVTALTGLATHREVLWVASAMTEEDAVAAEEAGGPVEIQLEDASYEVDLVISADDAYDAFYSVIANPQLWFTQHYLWDLSNAPDIRADEKWAWEHGYKVVNEDIARRGGRQVKGRERPLVMFHDYHLYTAPALVREQVPEAFLHHFVHIPWPHPDAWRILPRAWRDDIFEGLLANDIIGFHTSAYVHNFLDCCRELIGLRGRLPQRGRPPRWPRDLGARLPARDRRRPPAPRRRLRRGRGLRAASCSPGAAST